jgi:SNF2 family DNA or RNA helicase
MEMGTGKSKVLTDDAGHHFQSGDIHDAFFVVPNGLQRNWIDELFKDCGIPYAAAFYEGNIRKADRGNLEQLLRLRDPRIMRVLITSYESLRGKEGFDLAWEFCETEGRELFVGLDEFQRIKATQRSAEQRDSVYALGRHAAMKRIASGTATPNSPIDLYSPFKFLDSRILGHSTVTSFRAQYCELLNAEDNRVKGIVRKMGRAEGYAKYMQVQARDKEGRPLYKNLDTLRNRILPWSIRIRKSEMIDLPPKVYGPRVTFELSPRQRRIYDEVKHNIIAEFVHNKRLYEIDSALAIVKLGRLAAIAGNHFPDVDRNPVRIEPSKKNPRMVAMQEWIEDCGDGPSLIWARHTAEVDELCEVFKGTCVRYDGQVKAVDRDRHKKMFMAGDKKAQQLIGQVAAGIGFDAYVAEQVAFYTNDFSLEHRLQSEDRAHRIGLDHPVDYGDFEAVDTLDHRIIKALRDKREISEIIMGDPITNWI